MCIKRLPKAQWTQGIEYFDSINTFNSKRKLQQALKSRSNLGLVWFGKEREIHVIHIHALHMHFDKEEKF